MTTRLITTAFVLAILLVMITGCRKDAGGNEKADGPIINSGFTDNIQEYIYVSETLLVAVIFYMR